MPSEADITRSAPPLQRTHVAFAVAFGSISARNLFLKQATSKQTIDGEFTGSETEDTIANKGAGSPALRLCSVMLAATPGPELVRHHLTSTLLHAVIRTPSRIRDRRCATQAGSVSDGHPGRFSLPVAGSS